jgi:hypothetical protein
MQNKKLWSLAIVSLMSWLNAEIELFDLEDFERSMITQMSGSKRLSGIQLASNKYGISFRGNTKGFKKAHVLAIKRNPLLHEFTLMFGGNIIIGDGHHPIVISESNNLISWPSGCNVNLLGLDSSGRIITTSASGGSSTELGSQGNNWVNCPVEGDLQLQSIDGQNIDLNATTGNINVDSVNLNPNTNSIGLADSAGYPLIPFTLVGIDQSNNLIDSKNNLFLFGNIGSTSSYIVVDSRISENVGIIFKSPLITYPTSSNINILGINAHGQVVTTSGGGGSSTELGSQGNNWVNCPTTGDVQIQSTDGQNISLDSASNIVLHATGIDTESEWLNSYVLAADKNNNLITTNMINTLHVIGNINEANWLAVDTSLPNGGGIALITSNTNQNIALNTGAGSIILNSNLIVRPSGASINILGVNSNGQIVTTTGGGGSSTEIGSQGNNWVSCPVEGDVKIQSTNTQNIFIDSGAGSINFQGNNIVSGEDNICLALDVNNNLITTNQSNIYYFGDVNNNFIAVDNSLDQGETAIIIGSKHSSIELYAGEGIIQISGLHIIAIDQGGGPYGQYSYAPICINSTGEILSATQDQVILGNIDYSTSSAIGVDNSSSSDTSSVFLISPLITYPTAGQINVLAINSLGQVVTISPGDEAIRGGYFGAAQEKLNKLMEIIEILQEKVARLEGQYN